MIPKSNKRIKLEKEIFSTSIKDIEKMFSSSAMDDGERVHKRPQAQSHSAVPLLLLPLLLLLLNNSRLDILTGNVLAKTNFHYDCVNLSLIDSDSHIEATDSKDRASEEQIEKKKLMKPPILPSSTLLPGPVPLVEKTPRSVPLDLFFYEDEDDLRLAHHGLDSRFGCNLERDLKFIDQMFFPLRY